MIASTITMPSMPELAVEENLATLSATELDIGAGILAEQQGQQDEGQHGKEGELDEFPQHELRSGHEFPHGTTSRLAL